MKEAFFKLLQTHDHIFRRIEENPGNGLSYWNLANPDQHYLSPAFWKILGYSTKEAQANHISWKQLVAETDHALFQKQVDSSAPEAMVELRFMHRQFGPMLFSTSVIRIGPTKDSVDSILLMHTLAGSPNRPQSDAHSQTRRLKEMISIQGETMLVLDADFMVKEYYSSGLDVSQAPIIENWQGKHFEQLGLPKEVQLLLIEAIRDARIEGTKADIEYKTGTNGSARHYSASVGYIPGEDEAVLVMKDITTEKESVIQLSELSSLAAKTHDSTLLTNAKGLITWVNVAFEDLSGKSMSEMIGKPAIGFFCGAETDSHSVRLVQEAFQQCTPLRIRVVNESGSGRKYWLDIRIDPVFNEVGHCTHFVCVGRDATDQKLREEELLTARQFLLQTNQVARIGGWSYDVASDLVRWTDVMYDLHEVEHDFEPRVESVINFYEEGESRNRYYEAGMNAIHHGTPYDIELNLITAKGNKIRVRAIGNAEMEDGVCTRLYGTFQKIEVSVPLQE